MPTLEEREGLDFLIFEGGQLPAHVWRRCGFAKEPHPDDCGCGFLCPKCGLRSKDTVRLKVGETVEERWNRECKVEVVERLCVDCGGLICRYGVRL